MLPSLSWCLQVNYCHVSLKFSVTCGARESQYESYVPIFYIVSVVDLINVSIYKHFRYSFAVHYSFPNFVLEQILINQSETRMRIIIKVHGHKSARHEKVAALEKWTVKTMDGQLFFAKVDGHWKWTINLTEVDRLLSRTVRFFENDRFTFIRSFIVTFFWA